MSDFYAVIRSDQFVVVKITADRLYDAVMSADSIDPTNIPTGDPSISVDTPLQQANKKVIMMLDCDRNPIDLLIVGPM